VFDAPHPRPVGPNTTTGFETSSCTRRSAGHSAGLTDGFQYDRLGNRTTANLRSSTATTYANNKVNEYTVIAGTNVGHDDAGNWSDDGTYAFAYDYESFPYEPESFVGALRGFVWVDGAGAFGYPQQR